MYALQCSNLSKKYKEEVVLKDITINLEENKIYGLFGRNGTGKTTFLNIVSGQIFSTSGDLEIFGEKHFENEDIINKICCIKDTMDFMNNFIVKNIFDLSKDYYENWDEDFKEQLVIKFKLDINKKYRELSKGMKSMVGVIIGLASRAPLTIFDESYVGLDAAARQLFYEVLLQDYLENPRTIIFSTHLIDEISNVLEQIIIIHNGQILLKENMDTIAEKAFIITGKWETLENVISSKNTLKIMTMGNIKKAYVFDRISSEEIKVITGRGNNIKPMTLQELFVTITDN